ncbi:coiled-coil domain-containing protein 102A [Eurytemora carolleeae]|uniref:coiled-coil domain-containing protein 102A n=1 Tax=Eurytemora carolleeae TaxID=1294199 RepID=UPI000C7750A2|nr:coiled-coil domain-containing protein 102A [Eurytemora carolleeae]|eukprot:XP_023336176.1 coiled-coil domain-containing protein 102A-like [Eurytemora affinis]
MSAMKLGPPHPPVPPIPSTTPAMLVNWSGDAMDTLKLKIGLLKRENVDSSLKMEEAEKAKHEAEEKTKAAELKIRELSKLIHTRKIQLDLNADQLMRNQISCRRKEEALVSATEEINNLKLREMALQSELERVGISFPETSENLCTASQHADKELSEVKKLEIRAMLADQTIEEMEQQLDLAHNMAFSTNIKADEMSRKLEIRQIELRQAADRAAAAQSRLDSVNEKLKNMDRKMNCLQYSLEDKGQMERKMKKQTLLIQARLDDTEGRLEREMDALRKIKQSIDLRAARARK